MSQNDVMEHDHWNILLDQRRFWSLESEGYSLHKNPKPLQDVKIRTEFKRYDKFNFIDEQGELHTITDFSFVEPFDEFPGAVVLNNDLVLQNSYGPIDCVCFQALVKKRSTFFIIYMLCKLETLKFLIYLIFSVMSCLFCIYYRRGTHN